MPRTNDHVGAYHFHLEIAGVTVGVARQVLGLEGAANPAMPGGVVGARSPVGVAGAAAPFDGQYYVNKVTHNVGGSQSEPPGGSIVPSQVKVIILCGVLPTDQRGATELSRWLGQKTSPQLGRRSIAIVQRDPFGHELKRYSMDGWLKAWQGTPPVPNRPDPPPETPRVEIAAANLRPGR